MAELPVSLVRVVNVRRITPHMARITFSLDEHVTHISHAPDQQVKLYFPRPGQTVPRLPEPDSDGDVMRWYHAFQEIPRAEQPWMRSYTLRAFDPAQQTVDIDFVLHDDAGPATRWAQSAKPGDTLGMFGPSDFFSRPVPIGTTDWLLLAGDETALPAIGTIVEALPEGARALVFIEVSDASDEQRFETRGSATLHWLHRGEMLPGRRDMLVEAVRKAEFPSGSVFAWLAGEAGMVRALRRHLREDRDIDKRSIDFTGYWRLKLTQDDDPTAEDLAEAQERLADVQAETGGAWS